MSERDGPDRAGAGPLAAVHAFLLRHYRTHAIGFTALAGFLIVSNIVIGGRWWSFWPLYVFGILFAIHHFYVKSACITDDWVTERTQDLRMNSYDLGHIQDLEERVSRNDRSVRPSDRRDEPPRDD